MLGIITYRQRIENLLDSKGYKVYDLIVDCENLYKVFNPDSDLNNNLGLTFKKKLTY